MAVEIIAEVAQGYEGFPHQAKLLARAAARSGADAVKFQIIIADELCTQNYKYRKLFEQLEMPLEVWKETAAEARKGGLRFYTDVFGMHSLELAKSIQCDAVKLHTTDFYNDRLIRKAAENFKRLYISTGGITIEEVAAWVKKFGIKPSNEVFIMYGCQMEPTPLEANHLLRINSMKQMLPGFQIGFMDHTDGANPDAMDLALMALPMGVATIEKHITLDRLLELEDFQSALEPARFKEFTAKIRRFEAALGSSKPELTKQEMEYRYKAMKRLVASAPIAEGESLSYEKIVLKRFDSSEPPEKFIYDESAVLGKKLKKAVGSEEPIRKEMLV